MRLTSPRSPFCDPEFLRSINVVPYDTESDANVLRQREYEATWRFHMAQEREDRRKLQRGVFFGLVFFVIGFGVLWIGCAL